MYELCYSFYLIIDFYLALINNFIYNKKNYYSF